MLNIKVLSAHVEERTVAKDSKTYTFRYQFAQVNLYNKDGRKQEFPRECKIPLDDDQTPYSPGEYTLSPASFYLDRYHNISIGRLKLLPSALTKVA